MIIEVSRKVYLGLSHTVSEFTVKQEHVSWYNCGSLICFTSFYLRMDVWYRQVKLHIL